MVFELSRQEALELINLVEEYGNPISSLDIKLRKQFNFQRILDETDIVDGDQYSGGRFDYTIRHAAAGNWRVDVAGYESEATYACFNSSREAWGFILGMEALSEYPLTYAGNIYDEEENNVI